MRRFLHWLTARLPPPRVIYDRNGRSPYLSRWYLLGGPRMVDGSSPFDAYGAPRDGIVWPLRAFGVYLHCFHRGDDEQELHNHPWRWAVSIILAGGYMEERRQRDDRVWWRQVRSGYVNVIRANDFHRVLLVRGESWSLFIAGPKFQDWGFWNKETHRFWPWREFISQLRDPAAFARETNGVKTTEGAS